MATHAFDLDPFADGYVEEPPAPEPRSTLPDEQPRPLRRWLSPRLFCQIGHRCAAMAFLAMMAAAGLALYRRGEYWYLLQVAFIAADTALLCGVIASWLRDRGLARSRETLGLIVFSLCVLIPTITMVVLAKADRLNGLIDWTWGRVAAVETAAEQRLLRAAEAHQAATVDSPAAAGASDAAPLPQP